MHGLSAHAGLDPGKGASAIHELARQILALEALQDPARGITVNVGVLTGGSRPNVIADRASARSRRPSADHGGCGEGGGGDTSVATVARFDSSGGVRAASIDLRLNVRPVSFVCTNRRVRWPRRSVGNWRRGQLAVVRTGISRRAGCSNIRWPGATRATAPMPRTSTSVSTICRGGRRFWRHLIQPSRLMLDVSRSNDKIRRYGKRD